MIFGRKLCRKKVIYTKKGTLIKLYEEKLPFKHLNRKSVKVLKYLCKTMLEVLPEVVDELGFSPILLVDIRYQLKNSKGRKVFEQLLNNITSDSPFSKPITEDEKREFMHDVVHTAKAESLGHVVLYLDNIALSILVERSMRGIPPEELLKKELARTLAHEFAHFRQENVTLLKYRLNSYINRVNLAVSKAISKLEAKNKEEIAKIIGIRNPKGIVALLIESYKLYRVALHRFLIDLLTEGYPTYIEKTIKGNQLNLHQLKRENRELVSRFSSQLREAEAVLDERELRFYSDMAKREKLKQAMQIEQKVFSKGVVGKSIENLHKIVLNRLENTLLKSRKAYEIGAHIVGVYIYCHLKKGEELEDIYSQIEDVTKYMKIIKDYVKCAESLGLKPLVSITSGKGIFDYKRAVENCTKYGKIVKGIIENVLL